MPLLPSGECMSSGPTVHSDWSTHEDIATDKVLHEVASGHVLHYEVQEVGVLKAMHKVHHPRIRVIVCDAKMSGHDSARC